MKYKSDWEDSVKRYDQWWKGEQGSRPCIQIYAPKDNQKPGPPVPKNPAERFTNVDYVMESTLNNFENTWFLGEAFPCFWPNLGPDFLAALAGGELEFGEGTTWATPFAQDLSEVDFIFDENNPYWKVMKQLSLEAARYAPGNYIYGITDLHPSLDVLAAVRGSENLCLDLLDNPAAVKTALAKATDLFKHTFERLYQIGLEYQPDGCTTTLPVWSRDKYYINCCDFIYMISTPMFDEFAKPVIADELDYFDSTIFHVDGVGSLNHLDSILSLEKLKAIQWVYGEGQLSARHWIPVYKKILSAGKRVYAYGPPDDLPVILDGINSAGFMYQTWCKDKSEAEDLLKYLESRQVTA